MKRIILSAIILLSSAIFTPSMAWEIRGNIYPASDGAIQWNADNFAGFYLGGSEVIQLNISAQQIESGAAEYRSEIQNYPLQHKAWGSYSAISFLGQEYFEGYPDGSLISKPLNLFSQEVGLGTVLIDNDDSYTLEAEEPLSLQEGYNLKLSDTEGGIRVSLYNGQRLVDSQIVQPPADYIFEKNFSNRNATLIAVAVKANVRLEPKSHYTIKGIFQVSEKTSPIASGMKQGSMIVDFVSDRGIGLINPEAINLSSGQDIELMKGFFIKTSSSESPSEHLYIYRNASESETTEIMGEIASGDFSWTPQNFPGFYYDMDQDLGAEAITTSTTDNSNLMEPNGVIYSTNSQKKDFKFYEWGQYDVIAFLGERYIAGYTQDSLLGQSLEDSNLLSSGMLDRILIDDGEPRVVKDGSYLVLEEGLEAGVSVDKSCSKALVELYKEGELIDRDYIDLPNTYIYKERLAGAGKIAVLAIHISDLNCTPSNSCIVDGIFQISSEPINVNVDLSFGNMRIASVSTDTITMDNKDKTIHLNDNVASLLAGNYFIKAIDSEPYGEILRYYIFKPVSA